MDSFRYFSALPAELRIAIWKLARQPRVVEVWYDADADCCRTTAQPPVLLQVCRESRAEALHKGWYCRAFRTRSHSERYIYFSSTLDILYLPRHGLMGYDDTARDFTVHVRDTAEHVRALAIDHVRTDTIRPWEPYNKLMLLFSFPNVRETMLVVAGEQAEAAAAVAAATTGSSYDRRAVRRRSQDSIESAASVSSPSSPSSPAPPKGDVELVDPQGDTSMIMDMINNVIESFSREIQAVAAAADSSAAGHNTNPIAPFFAKSDTCGNGRTYPHIPYLIPKAIAYHEHQRQRRRQKKQRRAICA